MEKPDEATKPVEVKVVENPATEVVPEKAEETPAAAEESSEVTPAGEESNEASPAAAGIEATETNPATEAAAEESRDSTENSGDQEAAEETPAIKVNLPIKLSIISFCSLPLCILCYIFLSLFV